MLCNGILPRIVRLRARPDTIPFLIHLRASQYSQQQHRTLRTSVRDSANPLPITAHGPPPKPPLPAAGEIREMRRKQRERAAAAAAAEAEAVEEETEGTELPSHEAAEDYSLPSTGEDTFSAESNSSSTPKTGIDMRSPPPLLTPSASSPGSGSNSRSTKSTQLSKRFWKECLVKTMPDGSLVPHLDSRPLKTPQKQLLAIPSTKPHLAYLIAHEWNSISSGAQAARAYLMPLTQLASRVVDLPPRTKVQSKKDCGIGKARKEIVDMCMKYLDTDTLLCLHPPPNMHMFSEYVEEEEEGVHNTEPKTLRGRQIKALREVLSWIDNNVFPGITIHPLDTAQGFLATTPQPQETKDRIRSWIESRDDWELVGLERCVVSAKSLLVGIRLVASWRKSIPESTSKIQDADEIDSETGGFPPTTSSVPHNRGTNTPSSHTTLPHPRPDIKRDISSPDAQAGIDIDPETGGIVSGGELGANKISPTSTQEKTQDLSQVWGIEEAAKLATLEVSWQTGQWGEVEDTHDVEKEDVRRGLGAGWCLVVNI